MSAELAGAVVALSQFALPQQAERQQVADCIAAEVAEQQALQQEAAALSADREIRVKQCLLGGSTELRDLQQLINVICLSICMCKTSEIRAKYFANGSCRIFREG